MSLYYLGVELIYGPKKCRQVESRNQEDALQWKVLQIIIFKFKKVIIARSRCLFF